MSDNHPNNRTFEGILRASKLPQYCKELSKAESFLYSRTFLFRGSPMVCETKYSYQKILKLSEKIEIQSANSWPSK